MKIYEYVEAVPSRMVGVIRLLFDAGKRGLEEDAVKELLQPPSLRKPDAPPSLLAPRTIEAALESGLVVRTKDSQRYYLTLSTETFNAIARAPQGTDIIRELFAQRLLAPEIAGARNNFAVLCAWLLTRPITWLPQEHIDIQSAMQKDGLDLAQLRVTSEANIDNVLYWARYLGLVWWPKDRMASLIIPDPASFLVRHLDQLLTSGERVDAFAFRRSLGKICPVLDGGVVRMSVMQQVSASRTQISDEDCLSEGLSLAIRQLAEQGIISFGCANDERHFLRMYDQQRIAFIERPLGNSALSASVEAFT